MASMSMGPPPARSSAVVQPDAVGFRAARRRDLVGPLVDDPEAEILQSGTRSERQAAPREKTLRLTRVVGSPSRDRGRRPGRVGESCSRTVTSWIASSAAKASR